MKIRLLIADDHPIVRRGLHMYLATQDDIDVVAESEDAESTCAQASEHAPDAILLDLLMPGGGLEVIRRLNQQRARPRIIVLTSSEERALISAALKSGADSFLLKDSAPESVLDAIRRTVRGDSVIHPRIMPMVTRGFAEIAGSEQLSNREREVLLMIAEGASNAQIADRLQIGIKTVKTHVSNVLNKLGVEDRTQAAVFAWREGLQKA